MYGNCVECKDNRPIDDLMSNWEEEKLVQYSQWISVSEQKTNKHGETVTAKVTRKQDFKCKTSELVNKFVTMLFKFRRHVYNIRHQFLQYRLLKASLPIDACIVHIDFAENYACKYFTEIQSVHFGASHEQATLHNAVCYLGRGDFVETVTFCTISDSRNHCPCAIWVYLDPVLSFIKNYKPNINVLHFFSDGP